MPSGKKRKRHKMATHKRKKRLRKNRHKNSGHSQLLKSKALMNRFRFFFRLRWKET